MGGLPIPNIQISISVGNNTLSMPLALLSQSTISMPTFGARLTKLFTVDLDFKMQKWRKDFPTAQEVYLLAQTTQTWNFNGSVQSRTFQSPLYFSPFTQVSVPFPCFLPFFQSPSYLWIGRQDRENQRKGKAKENGACFQRNNADDESSHTCLRYCIASFRDLPSCQRHRTP